MEPEVSGVSDYDPALAETMRDGAGDDEVSVIARLSGDHPLPDGVRVITRFGDVATLRVRRDRIAELAASEAVTDLEATHGLQPEVDAVADAPDLAEAVDERADVPIDLVDTTRTSSYARRSAGLRATGRGVIVAVLDWGCDFAHPAFRRPDGRTRILALWDQRRRSGDPPNRWGYGRIHTRAAIDRALAAASPYDVLGYHPGDADTRDAATGEWNGCHGTHVLDIAAGNGRGGGMAGVAPDADLIFVHLAGTANVLGRSNLGDSGTLLEALDFVFDSAGDRPCVVNMSVGAQGGPKDGSTLVELGIDRAIWLKRGRATVHSCGNYYLTRSHADGRLTAGEVESLVFTVPRSDPTSSELELWYSGADRFNARVLDPSGTVLATVGPGQDAPLRKDAAVLGHIYHVRHTGNGDHHINLFLQPRVPAGNWKLMLRAETVVDGRFHAWIERERDRPEFTGVHASRVSTTGTICNGRLSIAVGAYDPHRAARPMGGFSSSGPTRDGRTKPELIAPGVRIRAARSCPPGARPSARYTVKDGTSMAAPHVTGTIALLFEAAREPLEIYDTRALLLSGLERGTLPTTRAEEVHRVGLGYLDTLAVERSGHRWAADHSGESADDLPDSAVQADAAAAEPAPALVGESSDTAEVADTPESVTEVADIIDLDASALLSEDEPGEGMAREPHVALDHVPHIIAIGGARPVDRIRAGDILVRNDISIGFEQSGMILGSPAYGEELAARGVRLEEAGDGLYVEVREAHADGSTRIVGRRLTDNWGRIARGQHVLRGEDAEAADVPITESGPPASVFLPARTGGYTDYVRAATRGHVAMLLNGRSSGGSGADVDLTQPLDEMERVVRSLGDRDRVLLGAWLFTPSTPLTLGPYRGLRNWGGLLGAKALEGVTIRIILNDFDPISGQDVVVRTRTLVPLRAIIAALPVAKRDNLKYILSLHPAHFGRVRSALGGQRGPIYIASHHQKFMIARRGESIIAFCGGLDIEDRKHPSSWSYSGLIAWHDMHLMMRGPIAYDVEHEFIERWNRERGATRQPPLPGWRAPEQLHPTPMPAADRYREYQTHHVQMTRTVSSNARLSAFTNNRDDIRDAYRRIVGSARRFLYFENQYLRSPDLGDEIVRQGRAHQDLQVLFVVVESAADDDGDNPLTRHGNYLQYEMLSRVVRGLGRGRVRVYTLFHRAVHAKVLLADDRYASIGSANANERSFQLDTEINITFDDEAFVQNARVRNWSFLLGESLATVRGWRPNDFFRQWDRVAAMNERLRSRPQDMQGGGVIPFDFTKVRGSRSRVIPDYLVKLDFSTDPLGMPPGGMPMRPEPVPPARTGVAIA